MTLRSHGATAISWCLGRLPISARNNLLRGLVRTLDSSSWHGFFDLSNRLPVYSVTVRTNLGLITGCPRDSLLFRSFVTTGEYVPELVALFRSALSNGGTYIDIGANIGLTLLPMAKLPGVRCIAFEPDPLNFS